MSPEDSKAPPAPRYRLQTLGTLVLKGPAGDAPGADHGQQGRRLALLAALAAAGDRGLNRDRLLLFFWPDATQERARHSLEQTLYLIRRSLDPAVFLGVNPLRLNPAVLTSDVEAFESALGEGRLEEAVELYRGPFLDGFYLGDAPEFEEWRDVQRGRLEASYREALERLAESAENRGDPAAAAGWWRRLADVDPLSSRPALGLVRTLAAAGDPATALLHARRYERLVQEEVGTGAGPELAALAQEIRAAAATAPPASRPPPHPGRDDAARATEANRPPLRAEALPDAPAPSDGGTSGGRWRTVAYAVVAVALVAAAVFAATRLGDEPAPAAVEPAEASIVVLPLANLSADPADALLADGMTEELIAMLAKVGDLRVIASTSAFAFRDRSIDVRAIADSLRVTHVLEGGVRKSGSRLRVQVRLIDARDGSTRWSETYDREIEDLFAVQEGIAGAVARELGTRLGERAAPQLSRHRPRSVAAYELYLRGSDPVHVRSDSGPHRALEYFRQAIAIDSTYAPAWAGLARMYVRVSSTEDPGRPVEELERLSELAARKAVALDDSLAEAHATLALVRVEFGRDLALGETELERAIALDPSYARAREWLVTLYIRTGRPAEALAEARRALEIDPLSPSAHAELAYALVANGRYDEALARLEQIEDVRPPLLRSRLIAVQAYAMKRMWTEALALLRPGVEARDARSLALSAYALARAGRQEEASRIEGELLDRWRQGTARAFDLVTVFAGQRDFDRAFEWLNQGIEDESLLDPHMNVMSPLFEDLRSDPRFERVRERLGIQKR